MKKHAICIFAHPDDEAFGPGGTIHRLTKTHTVSIICVTNGDAGENHHPTEKGTLATIRQGEIRSSSKIMGVTDLFFLNYSDGELCNNKYHEIAASIQAILDDKRPELLLTFEHRGISGHIDHITIAMIASYLYQRLSYVRKIMFYCLSEAQRSKRGDDYFIFFPPGYKTEAIDYSNDISDIIDLKVEAMKQHLSQSKDLNRILERELRTVEHFYVWEKPTTPKSSK
ncbi:PIG-L family deacetylase [Candidatus Microgenomates bacterium]|nr:PIG-L family deacetylase [Candidatus Microgenomates bacterium]